MMVLGIWDLDSAIWIQSEQADYSGDDLDRYVKQVLDCHVYFMPTSTRITLGCRARMRGCRRVQFIHVYICTYVYATWEYHMLSCKFYDTRYHSVLFQSRHHIISWHCVAFATLRTLHIIKGRIYLPDTRTDLSLLRARYRFVGTTDTLGVCMNTAYI